MRTTSHRLLLASLAALAVGCADKKENGNSNGDGSTGGSTNVPARPAVLPASQVDCGKGSASLSGRFLAPNGTTPVAGAYVYVASGNCWAGTDQNGDFLAKGVPSGATQVHAEKGVFQAASSGTPGQALSLKLDAATVKLGYVEGTYDTIETVLQRLGFNPTPIPVEELGTTDLSSYAAVFLNCGVAEDYADDTAVQGKLRAYVQNGGTLYASDWAETYVRTAFPGHITFVSPDARVGYEGEQQATVQDEGFKRALGRGTAAINYDLPGWALVDSVQAGTQVLVSGPGVDGDGTNLGTKPYLLQFTEGKGRVTYTTFHDGTQTTEDMNVLLEQLLFSL